MKTQLLQDIDESRIDFVPRGADKQPAATGADRFAPTAAVPMSFAPQPPFAPSPPQPIQPPQPPQPPAAAGSARSAVWSFKERPGTVDTASAAAAPTSPSVARPAAPVTTAAPAPPAVSAERHATMFDARDDEPPLIMPQAIEWPSRQAPPVLEPLVIDKEPDWFERWGRYASWAICLLVVVMFAAGGMWMYRESQIDGTMALLATKTASAPAPASQAPPAPPPAAVSLGSDALRQPDAVAPTAVLAPEAAGTVVPAGTPDAAPTLPASVPATVASATDAVTPSDKLVLVPPEQTADKEQPTTSVSREVAQVTTQPALAARARARQRPPATPKRTPAPAPEAAPTPAPASRGNDMAETLRQCRAMGYHSTQCIERGCYTTKYGLVCKG